MGFAHFHARAAAAAGFVQRKSFKKMQGVALHFRGKQRKTQPKWQRAANAARCHFACVFLHFGRKRSVTPPPPGEGKR